MSQGGLSGAYRRFEKFAFMQVARIICVATLALFGSVLTARADLISVPFQEGFVGQIGSSNRQATNVLRFSTLGISSSVVQQNSSTNVFESPTGNDIPVTLVLNSGIDTLRIPGNISWKIKQGNNLEVFGFTPSGSAAGFQNYTINYGSGSTLTLSSTSNYGLVRPPHTIASLGITDGSTQSGSNDPISIDELNAYLAEVRAARPYGPITVDTQTVSLSGASTATPILTGDACLVTAVTDPATTSVETISVVVDGKIYSSVPYMVDPSPTLTCQSATGFIVQAVTWSLQTTTGIAAGVFDVAATITSTKPYFNQISDSSVNELTVVGAAPGLTVTKTADVSGLSSPVSAGDVITYTITALNSGNVTLDTVSIADGLTPTGGTSRSLTPVFDGASDVGSDSAISVGETWTWTVSYTVLQSDLDAGGVSNLATMTAEDPNNTQIVVESKTGGNTTTGAGNGAGTVTTFAASPSIEGVKTVAVTTDADLSGGISTGDTLTYTIAIENTGNVTLTGVGVQSDTLSRGAGGTLSTVSGFSASNFTTSTSPATLAPGASLSHTATYVVTQADIDAGGLSNTATVVGTPPSGSAVTDVTDDGNTGANDTGADPTTAALQPMAREDRSFGNEIGTNARVSVLENDSYGGATSSLVKLVGPANALVAELNIEGEGTWTVGAENIVYFMPLQNFMGDPTPIEYVITSSNIADSNKASVYVDYLGVKAPDELVAADDEVVGQDPDGPVTLNPLANDGRGTSGELVRSTLRLLDANNNLVTEMVVAGEGKWTVDTDLGTVTFTPEPGFSGSNVSVNYYVENISGTPQTATIKILFIDPRGVVYDAETLSPLSGVTLLFADATGNPLPASCLAEGQQPQTTSSNGRYRFDLAVACTDLDGEEFQILITDTPGYALEPAQTGKQVGQLDPGRPASDIFEVVPYDAAPTSAQVRRYYTSFRIGVNSKQIVNNHIPLTPLVSLIEDQLREVLRDDLAATMTQQSRQIAGYAASALRRLQEQSPRACAGQINELLHREPILFETGSATISQSSDGTINRIAGLLATCEQFSFEVGGHTDDVADEAFNLSLSQARATAVVAALRQRGVPIDALSAKGFGERQPIADNTTDEGRQLNRRVEFTAIGRLEVDDSCLASSSLVRGLDATINQNGVTVDGELHSETRDCRRDGWNILEGEVSYLSTDQGMSQGMANLSYRTERFRTQDHLVGRFVGVYATNNDVTGLATGSILGFGLNAGLYGARRYESGLYLDYYLGGAAGRHNFNLDFDRSGGVIAADGYYTYVAAFAGAAVSGETMLGNYKLLPRAGFEGAWSPGGEADFDASRGLIEQGGALSTGEVVGLRLFGELRFEDLLTEHVEQLAVTPMVFCDRPMGEAFNACGAGLSFSLSREDEDTGVRYGIELTGEKTRTSEMFGVQMNYSQPFLGGEVTGTSSVSRNGHIAVGANYALEF